VPRSPDLPSEELLRRRVLRRGQSLRPRRLLQIRPR